MSFLDSLLREIASLEKDLDNDPRFKKLKHLKALQAMYADEGTLEEHTQRNSVGRPMRQDRSRALEFAEMFLRNRTGPVPTREIAEHLAANEIHVGGKDPVSNLSAMLSNSDSFVTNGRAGWTLADHKVATLRDELDDFDDIAGELEDLEDDKVLESIFE